MSARGLGLVYEEDEERIVNRKRVRQGIQEMRDELATTTAIMQKRLDDIEALLHEESEDDHFIVPDEEENVVDEDDVSWISENDANMMSKYIEELHNKRKSKSVETWWNQRFQGRLNTVISNFGTDSGAQATALLTSMREAILEDKSVKLSKLSEACEKSVCALCTMSRTCQYVLTIRRTKHYIGKSCATVVQAFINLWDYMNSVVMLEEDENEGKEIYGQVLGLVQAIEKAHVEKTTLYKNKKR